MVEEYVGDRCSWITGMVVGSDLTSLMVKDLVYKDIM